MRRCVFLDRDGVINVKPRSGHYICRLEDFEVMQPAVDWIRLFNAMGYLVIVITNQRCVAKGLIRRAELDEMHIQMRRMLAKVGARIDDVVCCPHEEGTCTCRKPLPGMVLRSQRTWSIDLGNSIMLGDSPADCELAQRCGMRFVEVSGGRVVRVVIPHSLADVKSAEAGGSQKQ